MKPKVEQFYSRENSGISLMYKFKDIYKIIKVEENILSYEFQKSLIHYSPRSQYPGDIRHNVAFTWFFNCHGVITKRYHDINKQFNDWLAT